MKNSKLFTTLVGAFALAVVLGGTSSVAQEDSMAQPSIPFDHWTPDGKAYLDGVQVGWLEMDPETGGPLIVENDAGKRGVSFTPINPSGAVSIPNDVTRPAPNTCLLYTSPSPRD